MTLPSNGALLVQNLVWITLKALVSFFTFIKNRIIGHPDPFGKRFDPSGWISRVVIVDTVFCPDLVSYLGSGVQIFFFCTIQVLSLRLFTIKVYSTILCITFMSYMALCYIIYYYHTRLCIYIIIIIILVYYILHIILTLLLWIIICVYMNT